MILVLKPFHHDATEFTPTMAENAPFLPGLSPVMGKPVQLAFDGGRLTSDGGVLVLAEIERRLGIAERLSSCLNDPRSPDRIRHDLAEMIRFRMLIIAAGYEDANDCDALRADPAFKMAVGRLPESGTDLCSQPTMCRLENLPDRIALARMMDAIRLALIKVAARVTEMVTRIKVALPSAFPYQNSLGLLVERAVKLPP